MRDADFHRDKCVCVFVAFVGFVLSANRHSPDMNQSGYRFLSRMRLHML
jgi:hypothetical protein